MTATSRVHFDRGFRWASACATLLLFAPQGAAWAAMGNAPPIVDSVQVSPTPVPANAPATIQCAAHDPDGNVTQMRADVTGGTLPNGGTSSPVTIAPGASVSGSIQWTTPAPGTYSVTCTASDNGGIFGGSASAAMTISVSVVQPAGQPPVIDSLLASSNAVLVGSAVQLTATAHDPDGDLLTFAWSASGGALTPSGETASFVAPSAGAYNIDLTVTDSTGLSAHAGLVIDVVLAFPQGMLRALFSAPRRLTATPDGDLLVVDAGAKQLWLVTRNGFPKGAPSLPDAPAAVATCGTRAFVVTLRGRLFELDPADGSIVGESPIAGQPLATPSGLACDPKTGMLFVAESEGNRVRALRGDGTTAFFLVSAGATPLTRPVDVAVDSSGGLVWVLLASNENGALLHAFAFDGTYVRSAGPNGSGAGQLTRGGGVAVMPDGKVIASDGFQGVLQTFDRTGMPVGTIGTYGFEPGQLRQPAGIAPLPNDDLLVATLEGRLERFGAGGKLPGCLGDSDCDGLPDAWEVAHGLNALDARDALADGDGDGLSSLREYALGTDPNNWDTDGDGYGDGDEVASGFNPLDPQDHTPMMLAGARVVSEPGLVQLAATMQNGQGCRISWTQQTGPKVALRGSDTLQPSFVAREAGKYELRGTATCAGVLSKPVTLVAEVREVAPRPDPGSLLVVRAGKHFLLDGSFSSDANGGALDLQWDQSLGQPVLGTTLSPLADARAEEPGLYSFLLTATDPAGNSAGAEIPVLAVSPGRQAPTAIADSPVFGVVGKAISLDASESVVARGAMPGFAWSQVQGPSVSLAGDRTASASFTPSTPGRYELDVRVSDGAQVSPPARVVAYVSSSGALPVASAPARLSGRIGEPLALVGRDSAPAERGARLDYRWRQISGPAAGLTKADATVATVVPFEAGTSVFELVVKEGGAESLPAFVRVDASAPGKLIPVAAASGPAVAEVGDPVQLDGRASADGDGHRLRFRWTQVGGPWVALEEGSSAVSEFQPKAPGLYVFELVVDDGQIKSAPARIGVLVFAKGGGR